MASDEMMFENLFTNLAFLLPCQAIKFSGLDRTNMFGRGLLKEHFCKSFVKINAYFYFSHYKSMEILSCHSKEST